MTIPLYTSIPPKLNRENPQGLQVGLQYQEKCIESWVRSGFQPKSINSLTEQGKAPNFPLVQQCWLSRDAQSEHNKPVLYIKDFLKYISENSTGVVAITNSDIILDFTKQQLKKLSEIGKDECVILKRRNIGKIDDREGSEHITGYDFFAAHADAFSGFETEHLALGVPWWDHFLPIWLRFKGYRHVNIENCVYHLKHEEIWQEEELMGIGKGFENLLKNSLGEDIQDSEEFKEYLRDLSRVESLMHFPIIKRMRVKLALYRGRGEKSFDQLYTYGLVKLNVRKIDNWRGSTHGAKASRR